MEYQHALQRVGEKVTGWAEKLIAMLPNLVVAILVILLSGLLAKLGRHATERVLRRLRVVTATARLVARVVQLSVMGGGVVIALSILQLDTAVTSLLAGVGIVGLALGFAFQDLASNFVAGVALSMRARYPFQIGDLVETNDILGIAEEIYLRNTVVRTLEGNAVILPNKKIFEDKLINYSGDPVRRVDLPCGISYGEDLRFVKRVVTEAIEGMEGRLADRNVEFVWTGYGDSSINFEVRFWIPFRKQMDYLEARSEAVMRVKEAFNRNDITIPFPIRTLDFGIKGGEKLHQMWPVRLANERPGEAGMDAE